MIRTKKELKFYIMADRMMNRGYFKPLFIQRFYNILLPDYIMNYLLAMRKLSYYSHKDSLWCRVLGAYYHLIFRRLGIKLGFTIGQDVFGYGLVIPHYGTIVVGGGGNQCGNFCVLQTSTCISGNGKIIGDSLYLATGAKITSKCSLGNNITIGANSVVNKSYVNDNVMIAGSPAEIKRENYPAWYVRDGEEYAEKVKKVEELKKTMNL